MRQCSAGATGTPPAVLAGKDYGMGSSRDWVAKVTALLGVRAVIAESYERIHRSNLVGMGVLPLQFQKGQNRSSLGLTGLGTFEILIDDGPTSDEGRGRARYLFLRDGERASVRAILVGRR